MVRLGWIVLALATVMVSGGCAGLLGIDEYSDAPSPQGGSSATGGEGATAGATSSGGGGTHAGGGGSGGGCPAGTELCGAECVDLTNTATHCGACDHDCLAGACQASQCQVGLASQGLGRIRAIVVDETDLYVADEPTSTTNIQRVPLHGGAVEPIQTTIGTFDTLLADDTYLYWSSDGAIKRIAKTGADLADICAASSVRDITLEGTVLYATATVGGQEGIYSIQKAATGGAPNQVRALGQLGDLAVADPWIYVHRIENPVQRIYRVNTSGGNLSLFSDAHVFGATELAVDSDHLYWVNSTNEIYRRVRSMSAAPEQLATNAYRYILQVEPPPDGYVYYASDNGLTLHRVQKTAPGTAEAVATSPSAATALTVDERGIYWGTSDGEVYVLAR